MLGDKWCGQHRVWHFLQRLIIVISCHRWQAFIARPSTLGMSDPKMYQLTGAHVHHVHDHHVHKWRKRRNRLTGEEKDRIELEGCGTEEEKKEENSRVRWSLWIRQLILAWTTCHVRNFLSCVFFLNNRICIIMIKCFSWHLFYETRTWTSSSNCDAATDQTP